MEILIREVLFEVLLVVIGIAYLVAIPCLYDEMDRCWRVVKNRPLEKSYRYSLAHVSNLFLAPLILILVIGLRQFHIFIERKRLEAR